MIDDTKQRRSLDLSPTDLSQSYVSSSLNEGSTNLNEIIGGGEFTGITSALDLPVFHPGAAGARTTPGDAGFAYTDTPQATVFIQKKQWSEQEWTYITGNDDERLGKVEETKMRIALGELIARKLDLLNDHELLTKFSEINANLSKIQQNVSNSLNPANVVSNSADPIMADVLTLAGTPVTKYYTETLTLTSPDEPKKKIQNKEITVKLAEEFDVLPPVVTRLLIRDAPFGKVLSGLKPGTKGVKTATPPVSEPPMFYKGVICNIVPVIPDEIPSDEKSKFQIATWWAIDLNKLKEEYMEYVGIQGGYDNLEDVRKNGAVIDGKSVGFVAVFEQGIATGVALSKATITQERPFNFKKDIFEPSSKVDGTIINTFNGVMELANVSSVTTNSSNQPSPGSASITLENPDNLLYITEDDIEIALGTRDVGDDSGVKEDGTPYQSGDKLSTIDPLTGRSTDLYFHNGKFYTQRAFNIVNRSDTSALGNFSSSTELEKINTEISQIESDLKAFQDYKNTGLVNTAFLTANNREYPSRTSPAIDALAALKVSITQFPVIPGVTDAVNNTTSLDTETKTDPFFKTNGTKVQKRIQDLENRKVSLNAAAFTLTQPGKLPPEKKEEVDKTLAYRRSQLRKYFLHRSIFEVYDRVYIWMSSPSRTTSRLADGTLVSEASNIDANQQIKLQRIREIISLIRQLDQVIVAIGAQQNQSLARQFSDEDLNSINEELFQKQESSVWEDLKSKIEEAFTPTASFFGSIGSIDPAISTLIKTIDNKILDLKTFSEGVKKSSKNLPSASTTSIANQSIDPKKFFEQQTTLAGIDEQQIQVFQGVITKISRSYNEGKYTITLQCEDNLNFLQRSRYIDVAAFDLPTTKARRFLDDPIWRPTRDERLTTEVSKNIEVNNLKGRWKTGIFTVSSKLFTGKDQVAANNQSSTQGVEDPNVLDDARLRKITAPFSIYNQPFRGADPASILSILITGQPIDPNLWMANTKHTGTMHVPTIANGVLKGDEKISVGPFAAIRAQQEEVIQKFGNFDPYIDLSHANVTKEERDVANLQSALNLASTIVSFVKAYVADPQRIDLFSSVVQKIQTEENQENGSGIYKQIDETNVGTLLVFDPAIMPKSVSDIKIKDGALGDPRLDFLVRAAIKGVPISQLEETFKNLATPDKDQVTFNKLVESTPPQTVSLFHNGGGSKYIFSTTNAPYYGDITETARSRATRGAVYGLLFNEQGNDSTTSSAPAANVNFPESSLTPALKKQIAALRGVELDKDGNKVISGNPIQATKASIIYNHKPNFFILANDYFRSPNLVDYVETLRPSPNAFQLDDWKTVLNRASEAAKMIDWELYADSQGHIRFKPPTYNRTLLRHVLDTTKTDIFLKTPFQNLFKDNNLTNATQALALRKIQTLTVQSKQKAIGLIDKYLNYASSLPVEQDSFSVSALFGLKEPTNVLGHMIENDFLTEAELKSLRFLTKASLNTDVSLVDVGLPSSEVTNFPENDMKIIKDALKEQTSLDQALGGDVKTVIDDITINYFSAEAFKEADISIEVYQTSLDVEGAGSLVSQVVDFFTGVDADSVSKAIEQALRTAAEITIYCTDLNRLLLTALAGLEGEISTAFQNLTDERFIHVIPNAIIYSEDYQESAPEYSRLDVFSTVPFIGVFPNQLQQDSIQWAGSVDYDLWRIYGEIKSEKITAPFLRRADQAVLYAHQLMARQYSKILTGQISVRGDSKYQVGDTVFIEDEGLYYYVTEVRHSFQYGSNYSTSLTLNYGRPIGTYIPYPFDILGDRLKTGINGIYQTDGTDLSQLLDDFDKAKAKETT